MPTVNIKAFSHKKSTVVENGGPKLPTAAQLELGEIAINFAKGYETLSIKNNNDEIVTFTNDNYWINKELAIAAALNDLNDRKQDALEMDETPTEGSENVVTSGGLYSYITEIEQVTAAALNDLNDRITSLALSDDYAAAAQGTPPLAGDTYETAISKLHKVIVDDELITSSALNDLNSRIDNLSLSEDYEAADPTSEPAGGDTYEEAISKLHGAILENELATSAALNDLNARISDIVVPELILSEDYEPSSLSNDDLFLAPGDSYETAFAKLEKTINDNENITSAALTDLDSRLNLLHLPQSLDDIPDGSTRKLSDYATTTLLATKQDTLVSGTNIKTINNESILGSGNITIEGGDESIITKYAGEIDTHEGRDLGNEPRIFRWIAMNYVFDGCTGGIVVEDSYESSSHVVTYRQTLLGYQKIYYRTSSTTDMSNSNWIESQSGDTNIIESVKVNGTALTPDTNKAVDITSIPSSIVTQDATHRFVSDTEKTTWNNKVSNVQADWNATSGLAQILNKPTIPAAVTESTVTGWGFTKNTGTVTGVKMNGTTKNPTSGVVDLGTVLTSFTETDPTVPAWAKAASKPTYTAAEVGALPDTYTPPVTSVNGQTGAVNLTIPAAPGTLNTTATTAQSTSSSEALSGNITLHKVAKTGTYNDLIGKPTIPAAQVQSDWNATSGMGVILNKPTIPTVNNATLTIQKNGTTVGTFTANASSNVTANIQVNELPTVSSSDNGKILMVVNGAWALVNPTSIYSGTSEPDSNTGNNGDLYLQTS